jgi:PAS domain S-box-containing protein
VARSERFRMPPDTYYSADMAQAIIETTTQPLVVLDENLIVRQCNNAFLTTFKVLRDETDGTPIYRLGNEQWNIPELRHLLNNVQQDKIPIRGYWVEHHFEQIGRRIMLLNATPIVGDGTVTNTLLAISDLTEREQERFELEGQKEYAEMIVDASRDALLILDWNLRVRTANETFYKQFQVDPAETEGRLVYELGNGQWDIPVLRELLERVLPDNNAFDDFQVEHNFENVGHRVMMLNGRRIDHMQLILLAIEDITERRRYEDAIGASEERLRKVLETDAVGVLFFDQAGTLTDCNDSFLRLTGYTREDVEARRLTWRNTTPPEWIERSEEQWEKLVQTGRIGPYERQCFLKDGSKPWMIFAGRDLGDGTIVKFCIDISDRKQAEEERELLARELSHRVKNMLAVVQSLATQTASDAKSIEEYRNAFLGRLKALARAHSLLVDAQWQTANLKSLVEQATDAYRIDHPLVVEIDGEPVCISSKKSLGLTLVLHELGTNAAKYGALAHHNGRLNISWQVETTDGGQSVRLTWRERDGPSLKAPVGKGFGSRLIERASVYELGGNAELDYAPSGLVCTITFPVP